MAAKNIYVVIPQSQVVTHGSRFGFESDWQAVWQETDQDSQEHGQPRVAGPGRILSHTNEVISHNRISLGGQSDSGHQNEGNNDSQTSQIEDEPISEGVGCNRYRAGDGSHDGYLNGHKGYDNHQLEDRDESAGSDNDYCCPRIVQGRQVFLS